jgi:hypothetical protein
MATSSIKVDVSTGKLNRDLRAKVKRLKNPGFFYGGVYRLMREWVRSEFAQGGYRSPTTGSISPWKRPDAFGTRPVSLPMDFTGALSAAWSGSGPARVGGWNRGSAWVGLRAGSKVGVYGIPLRGGSSPSSLQTSDIIIRPKPPPGKYGLPRMFWFLGMTYKVWISPKRLHEGLRVKRRHHAHFHGRYFYGLLGRMADRYFKDGVLKVPKP